MHDHTLRHGRKLFSKANETDHRAVVFEPRGSAAWAPPSFSGGLIGVIEGSRKQILNGTHGSGIYCGDGLLQD
jgi:hypothetical protein